MSNKNQILHTALELFAAQGYDRTPTSQIARQAGVSEGLIFRHFSNKAGLLQAIILEGLSRIAGTMSSYQENPDPQAAIVQHIERAFEAIRAQETFWRFATGIRFQPEIHAIAGQQIDAVNRFVVESLQANFQRLGRPEPAAEALALFAAIDGICLHWLQAPQNYPLERVKNLLIKQYSYETS